MKIKDKYSVSTKVLKGLGSVWNTLKVSIYEHDANGNKKKIGRYKRNYSSLNKTFVPFRQRKPDGSIKEYALFSDKYVRTAVMELPSCKVIAEEPIDSMGFCPVEYKVPFTEDEDRGSGDGLDGMFGFVSGCI